MYIHYSFSVKPFLISFILSLPFSGDINPSADLSSLRPPFFKFHKRPPLGFLTVLKRWFPPNFGRVAGESNINADTPNSFNPCAGDSSGTAIRVRFPVPPLSFRFFFLGIPASVSMDVFALASAIEVSSSRMVVSVGLVCSSTGFAVVAARLDLLPPKRGMERPMMEVLATIEGDCCGITEACLVRNGVVEKSDTAG